ncbi:type II toxin-antitoxin system RelE/ParE family toxin [bacterium]|nr:type II toxin-antitoxin system RelE/ParE family toxin [bacterium]
MSLSPNAKLHEIIVHKSAQKEFKRLPSCIVRKLKEKLSNEVAHDPYRFKPLSNPYKGLYRLKFSAYRIIYKIVDEHKIVVVLAARIRNENTYKNIPTYLPS